MKTASVILLWLSIGMGVSVGYTERHHKKMPDDPVMVLVVAAVWPALVAADAYRAFNPANNDACTVSFNG